MAKKKTTKKSSNENESRKKKLSPLLQYMMDTMKEYLVGSGISRNDRAERRKKLASCLGKGEGTLKNMYLYG